MELTFYIRNLALALIAPLTTYFISLSIFQSLLLILIVIVYACYENSDPSLRGLPPGPKYFPLIGRMQFLMPNIDPQKYFAKLHEEFGSVISFTIGTESMVLVSDYELVKEISMRPDFQLRPVVGIFQAISHGLGIVAAEGNLWKHQRRFLLNSLRNSGMGKLYTEDGIREELKGVKSVFNSSNGQPIQVHDVLEKSTCNVMFSLAFNKRYDYEDNDFKRRIKALDDNFRLLATTGFLALFRWLKPISGFLLRKLHANIDELKSQAQEVIEEHRNTLDIDDPRDLLDYYLMEMEKKVNDDDAEIEYHKTFYEEQLKFFIIDIFAGGTETASTTIRWALLYMIHHPDIQTRVQKELDEVLGIDGVPSMEIKAKLPYTVATLQEIERLGSVIPISLPRSNDHEVTLCGYRFPKRSTVFFNLYAVNRDPKNWKDPEKFDPSRFINDEGKVFRPAHLLPFGSGRRACPGEALAKMEIFIYFATLVKNFRFENPPGEPLAPLTGPRAIARAPQDYKILCHPRSA